MSQRVVLLSEVASVLNRVAADREEDGITFRLSGPPILPVLAAENERIEQEHLVVVDSQTMAYLAGKEFFLDTMLPVTHQFNRDRDRMIDTVRRTL